jgi:hypothetical protein
MGSTVLRDLQRFQEESSWPSFKPPRIQVLWLPISRLLGLRNEQPGIEAVLIELAHALPQYADASEVHGAFYSRILQASANIDKLAEHEIILAKQLEVVRETKAQLINNREYDIGSVAAKVAESATRQKKPELILVGAPKMFPLCARTCRSVAITLSPRRAPDRCGIATFPSMRSCW